MAAVAAALEADEQARFWTKDPVFDADVKKNWLASFMAAKAPKVGALTYNFAVQVAENGRMHELPGIAEAYARLMSAERGEVKAEVTTALPLSEAQRERVAASLHRFVMPGQQVELEVKVDESILGGMFVKVGDKFVDLTVKKRMNDVSAVMGSAGADLAASK